MSDAFTEAFGDRRGSTKADAPAVEEPWWCWERGCYDELSAWLAEANRLGYEQLVLVDTGVPGTQLVRAFRPDKRGYAVFELEAKASDWLIRHWPEELLEATDLESVRGRLK